MKLLFGDRYQLALIFLGVLSTLFFGVFFLREIFPEYRIYQNDFVALEKFRTSYTGEPTPPFQFGVKQIVTEREDKGPAKVERCISCHVALQIPDYSPTTISMDSKGNPLLDEKGVPIKVENKNYIWRKLDEKIADLRKQGKDYEADQLSSLKTAQVGEIVYDVTKVLSAHPLIGKETRPFEFHPMSEYGCVSCHNGNGLGLVTDKAHGPVFDGMYETEFMGYKPEFLERDPKNDPLFARVFNDKPGHKLLFQTEPLYVGALMQAKCVDCHLTESDKIGLVSQLGGSVNSPLLSENALNAHSGVQDLIQDYQRGGELFVSQACYACHRISGYARGGVGPELTKEGYSYPWFIKESIVWPQADLKTSTMPNYRLDHHEVEDLMTFLLAQKGERRALSGTLYQNMIANWDRGAKQAWEKPATAAEIQDVNYGLTVFATEGCAACHRLKGYQSSIGFASEKDEDPKKLFIDQSWFTNLFSEQISGSDLYQAIEKNKNEIDKKIVRGVRKEAILDKIEQDNPDLIAAYYPAFRFVGRKSTDPAFQERLNRVLMAFVQTYGLGRQIGPKPNWSGVYRSDKWLYEHFKNPQAEIPRSIMPVMPFDDTKFYALVRMLDVVGKKNKNELREEWKNQGFDPEAAYKLLCAQCHGDYLEGNGPVAEWIYPIPKNLRAAEFLRNLTKERVKDALVHGVKGTPMPPWGEVKGNLPGTSEEGPVLTNDEIDKLTDWLFSFLQGGQVIRESQDVPKWQYGPKEIIEELNREGEELLRKKDFSSLFPTGKGFVAALGYAATEEPNYQVSDLFDVVEGNKNDPDKARYYIKKEYYTPENITEGQTLFWENCASCHGNEGDGAGLRAEAMYDAKPRMLTNLNWIESRDDLRLLRSIKFGVSGTSMQPWGDITSSKQRMQLVIFIRSLTQEAKKRTALLSFIYQGFDQVDIEIKQASSEQAKKIAELQNVYEKTQKALNENETLEDFKANKQAREALESEQEKSQLYSSLRQNVKSAKESLQSLGLSALSQSPAILQQVEKLIQLSGNTLTIEEGKLRYTFTPEKDEMIIQQGKKIEIEINKNLDVLKGRQLQIAGQINSNETARELASIKAKIAALESLKTKLEVSLSQNKELRAEQAVLIKEIYNEP